MQSYNQARFEAIIYDLDNTIYPAREFCEPIFIDVMHAIFSKFDDKPWVANLEDIKADMFTTCFADVAKKYSLPNEIVLQAKSALELAEFKEQLVAYEDCHVIKKLPVKSFLVTSGNSIFQQKKIENLEIEYLFEGIYIDDEDAQPRIGKESIFQEILNNLGCKADQIIVVGDNISSEIEAGNKLGMHTIQILREGVKKGHQAKQHIYSFTELPAILQQVLMN